MDGKRPTKSAVSVAPGRHSRGNTVYVSVAFSEIVVKSGTPYLETTWGRLYYVAGSGSNVLTFSGKIKDQSQRLIYNAFADDAFHRFDGGLRLGCGLQYDYLYAELGYDIGLANVSRDDFETAHTGCFFANIGINF